MLTSRYISFVTALCIVSLIGCSNSSQGGSEGGKFDEAGKKTGHWVHKNQSGGKKSEGKYIQGLKDGKWTFFQKDLTEITTYKAGKKHGPHEQTYKISKVVAEKGNYLEDVKDGEWIKKRSDNQIISIGSYDKGKKHGSWKQYATKERISSGEYVQGKKSGEWTEWQLDKKHEGTYSNGIQDGLWTTFDSKDEKIMAGTYSKGRRVGEWQRWYPGGEQQLALVSYNNMGAQSGTCIAFHENGQKQMECLYKDGKPEGKMKFWDEDGKEIIKPKKRIDFTDMDLKGVKWNE